MRRQVLWNCVLHGRCFGMHGRCGRCSTDDSETSHAKFTPRFEVPNVSAKYWRLVSSQTNHASPRTAGMIPHCMIFLVYWRVTPPVFLWLRGCLTMCRPLNTDVSFSNWNHCPPNTYPKKLHSKPRSFLRAEEGQNFGEELQLNPIIAGRPITVGAGSLDNCLRWRRRRFCAFVEAAAQPDLGLLLSSSQTKYN